jgi:hypothetical protein
MAIRRIGRFRMFEKRAPQSAASPLTRLFSSENAKVVLMNVSMPGMS